MSLANEAAEAKALSKRQLLVVCSFETGAVGMSLANEAAEAKALSKGKLLCLCSFET